MLWPSAQSRCPFGEQPSPLELVAMVALGLVAAKLVPAGDSRPAQCGCPARVGARCCEGTREGGSVIVRTALFLALVPLHVAAATQQFEGMFTAKTLRLSS
ncbi:MAG: hypothetical protein ACREMV_07820, partial [Gemmatimonadales bacterium]